MVHRWHHDKHARNPRNPRKDDNSLMIIPEAALELAELAMELLKGLVKL